MKLLIRFFTDPSYRLLLNYRIGRWLILRPNKVTSVIAKWYRYQQVTKRGCQISYRSKISSTVKFPHPLGIVIGDAVEIGEDVMIWQNVTLGSHGKKGFGMDYPIIGRGVRIYEGATIIGNVRIGDYAIIGAKSLVNKDVPANGVAMGIPAKIKEL